MDIFTRSIRGWHLGQTLHQELSLTALQRALATGRRPEIHHSDQGVQYAASAYIDALQGTAISMAEVGKAWQNGFAERLIRTIKEEEVDLSDYHDYQDAFRQLGRFLDEVYMRKRIHSSLGYGLTFRQSRLQWDQPPREGESGQVSKPSHLVFSLSKPIFVSSRRGAPHRVDYRFWGGYLS